MVSGDILKTKSSCRRAEGGPCRPQSSGEPGRATSHAGVWPESVPGSDRLHGDTKGDGATRSTRKVLGLSTALWDPDENDPGNELQKREYRFREGIRRKKVTDQGPPTPHAIPLHSSYPFVPFGPGVAKPHSVLGADDAQVNDRHITCPQVTALQLGRVARQSLNSLFQQYEYLYTQNHQNSCWGKWVFHGWFGLKQQLVCSESSMGGGRNWVIEGLVWDLCSGINQE